MKNHQQLRQLERKILPVLKRHGAVHAGVFGSFVRGEARKTSDIDILIEIRKDISLLDFIGIKLELEEALKRKVDLVEYDTIKPLLRERILKEQVKIL